MTVTSSQPAAQDSPAQQLRERLEQRTAVIGIVGLGYVGLPLARAVHAAGYPVLGYDVDAAKVASLGRGENYLTHLGDELAQTLATSDRFNATADAARLAEADVILLCVPTPLGKHHEPDLSFVLNSTRMVARVLRPGQLVVLESTTYPGTTRDEMLPILAEGGLACGSDFFLAYSPEREDPGRPDTTTATIPKLVGGIDDVSGDLAMLLYESIVAEAHRVSRAEIAEAAKLLENIYRAVNIAMVNELKVLFTEMDIDVWEVIAAASTKPFGFQPFFPGPGLGGHCIPIDPFYLTWKAKEIGRTTRFIELAGEINNRMPEYVVTRVAEALNDDGKSLRDASVCVLGIAYKPDIDDIRESPAAEIIDRLVAAGCTVAYHDPHVPVFPRMRKHRIDLASVALTEPEIAKHDCVLVVTDHAAVDYDLVGRCACLVVDTRNAMSAVVGPRARVVKA
ncbi:MAG: nucleotide sugar dehydrogenase [Phycisphaerales bacterium]|nr:nucleotide sugar dehydrogenase [Phycisphaerae bacterium]NNF42681.1 nucleotide sugar dehydrogenase [Phycisphaerales bacterium]NNM26662.1 nucleotide sugar dehydrogenase [Phycisphaerales bacterium]